MNINKLGAVSLAVIILTGTLTYAAPVNKLAFSEGIIKNDLPSASGMIYDDGNYYIVGDDSPYLYKMDRNFNIEEKLLLKEYPLDTNGRIPKSVKPDFEAMDSFKWKNENWIMIIGSGSKAVKREVAFLVNEGGAKKLEKNMAPFYQQLAAAAGFGSEDIVNLEGFCVTKDRFLFVNRCNAVANIIFSVPKKDFLMYVEGKTTAVKDIKTYRLELPQIDGYLAGLSGAEYIEDTDQLVLTASVEVTGDPINDGKILGSFVGVMPLKNLKDNMDASSLFSILEKEGKPFVTKVESVAVSKVSKNLIKGALASDNDDGTSVFYNFELKIK
ncbi:MAG: hypothetical protein N2645_00375 [Clostridia bacterium]|nr:hypothetical protein [Clostridia bacterium]